MDVERFSPAPDGDGFLGITGTRTPGPWRWNPTWTVESTEPGSATLNAGADRRVAIDGLRPTTLSAMTLWTTTGRGDACDDEQRIVLDRLASSGAAIPPPLLADTVAVVTTGRPGHPAAEAIVDHLQHLGYRIADRSAEATGLVIVVRGTCSSRPATR